MSHDWRNPERVAPWKPRHRFRVTAAGEAAARGYREAMTVAQQGGDARAALERAKQDWAAPLGLRPGDGILIDELAAGASSLSDLQPTMEACDLSLRDARGVLDRLVASGLIESLEPVAPVPWRPQPGQP